MSYNHAKLSPSSAERWFNCPGSINLIATLPESAFKTSKHAAEGSVAHALAEQFIKKEIDFFELTAKIGESVMHDGYEIEITDDMIAGISEYQDGIYKIKYRLHKPIPLADRTESKVRVAFDESVWGTADKILYQKGHELHVIDFKYGKTWVEAEENSQGMIYLVAVQDTEAGKVFDRVFFHICQPRAKSSDGDTWRSWELPKGRLEAFRVELAHYIEATKDLKATRTPGKWCRFCPALAYCPEVAGNVQAAAKTEFTKLPAPASKEVGQMSLPMASELTPAQVASALDWEESIDSWFEAIRARALEELSKVPGSIPGYKVVEGRANRVWAQDDPVIEAAFSLLGDTIYAPRKILSPAQMEKIAGKEEVAKYTTRPPGKLTVAKDSDKRSAAVLPSNERPQDVFEPIVEAHDNIFGDLIGTSEKKKEPIWP